MCCIESDMSRGLSFVCQKDLMIVQFFRIREGCCSSTCSSFWWSNKKKRNVSRVFSNASSSSFFISSGRRVLTACSYLLAWPIQRWRILTWVIFVEWSRAPVRSFIFFWKTTSFLPTNLVSGAASIGTSDRWVPITDGALPRSLFHARGGSSLFLPDSLLLSFFLLCGSATLSFLGSKGASFIPSSDGAFCSR